MIIFHSPPTPFNQSGELLLSLLSEHKKQKQILALLEVWEFSILLFQKTLKQALSINTFRNWERKNSEEKIGEMKAYKCMFL